MEREALVRPRLPCSSLLLQAEAQDAWGVALAQHISDGILGCLGDRMPLVDRVPSGGNDAMHPSNKIHRALSALV